MNIYSVPSVTVRGAGLVACICSAVLKEHCPPREGHLLTSERLCRRRGAAPLPGSGLQMKEQIATEPRFRGSLSPAWGLIHY